MTAFDLGFTHSHEYSPVNVNWPAVHIHMLPVELLQQVFLLVVNDVPDCPGVFAYGDTTISANVGSPPLVFTYSWLARSGDQPLTLRILSGELPVRTTRRCTRQSCHEPSQADSQLLGILLSESKRWGTVALVSADDWNHILPPVTMCVISGWRVLLPASYAPLSSCSLVWSPSRWMQSNRILAIHIFQPPILCLESITIPIPSDPFQQREVLKIFGELCLPMLRKLTLVADPEESEVSCIMTALEIASCDVQVVDFQTTIPLGEVDVDVIEPLFSVARENSHYIERRTAVRDLAGNLPNYTKRTKGLRDPDAVFESKGRETLQNVILDNVARATSFKGLNTTLVVRTEPHVHVTKTRADKGAKTEVDRYHFCPSDVPTICSPTVQQFPSEPAGISEETDAK
ncbi:uncharacterized protein BJ212DRAFT_1301053 [Suillus subaureus]|uniref:Uncharacterized protein n=1 Tax=Suillus subaureus TaxID=48587 RepID=A0A9P7E7T8_9AGAM|nr:uncharacterized protein BJ212DRAFT_1301053 [Suillus subaureus]KAG1813681.1 hypothetical protein BJ212DRAFT_1301053 [Suillus subaureus]